MPSEPGRRFPRARRLRRRGEFQRVYSHGIRVAGRYMVLFGVRSEGEGRFGVTASRKVGHAVSRARSKRRLRELYRHRRTMPELEAVDLVVNAKASSVDAPWTALEHDFDECLGRLAERLGRERR